MSKPEAESARIAAQGIPQATSPQPLVDALMDAGADPKLAYAGGESVRNIASEGVLRELGWQFESLRRQLEDQSVILDQRMAAIGAQMQALEARMQAQMQEMRAGLEAQMRALEAQIQANTAALEAQRQELKTHRWVLGLGMAVLIALLGLTLQKPQVDHSGGAGRADVVEQSRPESVGPISSPAADTKAGPAKSATESSLDVD